MKLIIILLSPCLIAQNICLEKLFIQSVQSPNLCDSLIRYCERGEAERQAAYLAAGYIIKAKHMSSKIKKFKYFKKGKRKLEDIISKYPNIVEYRWIRYCIQSNIPRFLNYTRNISEDTKWIYQHGNTYQRKTLNTNEYWN